MIPKGTKYQGGARGGRKISTTYNPGMRPGDSDLTKERQSLIRRFGTDRSVAGGVASSTGHTATSGDPGTLPAAGIWASMELTVADNSSETLNFGASSGIAVILIFASLLRNFGTPVRVAMTLQIMNIGGVLFDNRQEIVNPVAAESGISYALAIVGPDVELTFTTTDETPNATADISMVYTIIPEV